MALRIEEDYRAGIPQTIVAGFAPRGLAWHWTAGGTGRAGAESTIQHFINTRLTVNASYHILLFREGDVTVAKWIVPMGRASHGLNPANAFVPKSGSAREAARFTEVHRILGRDSDPNADCVQVSFCGMPADLKAAMADPVFVADVRALARQLIAHPNFIIDRPHFGHGWIQPITRYEADERPEGPDLLIAELYGEAPAPPAPGGTNMADIAVYLPQQCIVDANAALRAAPSDAAAVVRMTTAKSTVMTVGTKNGFHAFWDAETKRWVYTKTSANILKAETGSFDTAAERAALVKQGQKEGADAVLEAAKSKAAAYGAS